MAFPTLSKNPSSITARPLENVIKSGPEAGIPMTRKRWTRNLFEFDVEYYALNVTDMGLLFHPTTGFYQSVGCHTIFTWTNYLDSTTYNVRFKSPVEYPSDVRHTRAFDIKFTLETA